MPPSHVQILKSCTWGKVIWKWRCCQEFGLFAQVLIRKLTMKTEEKTVECYENWDRIKKKNSWQCFALQKVSENQHMHRFCPLTSSIVGLLLAALSCAFLFYYLKKKSLTVLLCSSTPASYPWLLFCLFSDFQWQKRGKTKLRRLWSRTKASFFFPPSLVIFWLFCLT